jgi:hypothetical protein
MKWLEVIKLRSAGKNSRLLDELLGSIDKFKTGADGLYLKKDNTLSHSTGSCRKRHSQGGLF